MEVISISDEVKLLESDNSTSYYISSIYIVFTNLQLKD